ncbi:hypothetical protein H9P43_002664 [Blastocladiella emersonii ATCC 22665]|nr:hypothetical protein H9P43_002664 [Blastocladiella emersonii ATCC 22665]
MLNRFGSDSNHGLVKNLAAGGVIQADRIATAMTSVDRALFVPEAKQTLAYNDLPLGIGYAATISAPHAHAHALQLLEPFLHEGARVLDVGSGSGYLVAVLSKLVGPTGAVVGIEHIPELVAMGRANLEGWNPEAVSAGNLTCVEGDGRKGYPDRAPYQAIHVGAAAPELPADLVAQLASPGRMIIPVGARDELQSLMQVDKDEHGEVTITTIRNVKFVPLTSTEDQLNA